MVEANDMVKNPVHYARFKFQPIEFIEANGLDYNTGNVIKYVMRAPFKGNELQDLEKAREYIDRMIALVHKKRLVRTGPPWDWSPACPRCLAIKGAYHQNGCPQRQQITEFDGTVLEVPHGYSMEDWARTYDPNPNGGSTHAPDQAKDHTGKVKAF